MNAKEIGRKAGRIFEFHLPDHWVFRSQEDQEDYGIDGEIEVNDSSDHATGFIFKAQIKGQKAVSIINNGTTASFSISVKRLKYYMRQVEIPIILAVIDLTSKKVFWKSLQDDEPLRKILQQAIDKSQDTVAVHLLTSNTLPEKTDELLVAVESNMNWLRVSALNRMTAPIDNLVKKSPDDVLAEMLEKSKLLNLHIYSEKLERLYVSGEFDKLFVTAKTVINSTTEKVETRFWAGLYIERYYLQVIDPKSEEYQKNCFNLFVYLVKIAREGKAPLHIRLYVILLVRSMKLKISVDADYHYYISAKMAANDGLTKWVVDFSRAQVVLRAAKEVEKVIHLINRIILSSNNYVLLETLPRVCSKISVFAHRLQMDGSHQQADYLYSWMKFCIDLAVNLSKQIKQENSMARILYLNASFKLNTEDASKYLDETFELAKEIQNESIRNKLTDTISKMRSDLNRNNEDATPEAELEFFRDRAKALGMNVDDPEDEMGKVIQQGLLDYNPERILKNCKHLLVFPSGAQGIPARMVGLPTAAMKWIYCLENGHAMGGWSLDDIYICPIKEHGFKEQFCEGCQSKEPRDETWKWSSKWQNAEVQKYRDIIVEIDSI